MSESPFRQDFGSLVEAGFIAVKQSNKDAAQKLFRAAQILNPNHTSPMLGFGYIALNELNLSRARECFEDVLKHEPGNEPAKIYLGFSLILMKLNYNQTRSRNTRVSAQEIDALYKIGTRYIQAVVDVTKDEMLKRFGQSVLELGTKASEYATSPLQPTAKN